MSDGDPMRINKFISACGVTSRRKADKLVEQGRVKVNGEVMDQVGYKVTDGDIVEVDGEVIRLQPFSYVLLNKDKDVISTTDDPKDRKTVVDLNGMPESERETLFPVGRLDRNTTGVLLLTNDGDLAHRLMHPSYGIEKLYLVRTRKNIKPDEIDALRKGIELEDGLAHADGVGYVNLPQKNEIGLQLHEGRNRQIRRMMEKLGHDIVHLERVSYAGIDVNDMDRGRWRRLSYEEASALRKLVDLDPPPRN